MIDFGFVSSGVGDLVLEMVFFYGLMLIGFAVGRLVYWWVMGPVLCG